MDNRWHVVLPTDHGSGQGGGQAVLDVLGAWYRVTPAEIEQAVERTGAKDVADLHLVFERVRVLYEARLSEQRELIAELRRRAAVAEEERDALRGQLTQATAPQAASAAPGAAGGEESGW